MPNDPKPWYTSKTVWAGLVASILPLADLLANHFHIILPSVDELSEELALAGGAIAGAIAIYTRITAKSPIGKAQS